MVTNTIGVVNVVEKENLNNNIMEDIYTVANTPWETAQGIGFAILAAFVIYKTIRYYKKNFKKK